MGTACGPQVRIIDLKGARDAAVFLVHLTSGDAPTSTEGPFLVDSDGVVEERDEAPLRGFDKRTEALVIGLAELEQTTAVKDRSSRRRVRFRSDASCLVERSCALSLVASPGPRESRTIRGLGESVGFIESSVPPEILVAPTDTNASWIRQLKLRVPFDLELVEKERLLPFGNVEEWTVRLGTDQAVRDYVPLRPDRIAVVWDEQLCLVSESMTANEICAPGPNTLDRAAFGVTGTNGVFTEVLQDYANGEKIDRLVVVLNSVISHLARVDITDSGFAAINEVGTSSVPYEDATVNTDGTLMVGIAYDRKGKDGYLQSTEYVPGELPRVLEVRRNEDVGGKEDAVDNSRLLATNDPDRPFVAGTENSIHVRYRNPQLGPPWGSRDFLNELGNFKVKAIAGFKQEGGQFDVWSAHNNGMLFRFSDDESAFEPRPVQLSMPNAYVEQCEDISGLRGNLPVSDFRDFVVRGPHDAFAVLEGCALLLWLDPDPRGDPESSAVSLFRTNEVSERWPMFGGRTPQQHIKFLGDTVWVGGGGYMRRVTRPAL